MGVNVLSQGRQINASTISSNSNTLNNNENQQVKLPVAENEKSSNEMEHGRERYKNASEDDIKKAVNKLNKFLQGEATHVEYERHDKLKNEFVIRIVDNNTREVVKEIPPKKILDMVAEMCKLAGIIVDEKA
ncbi:flagellin [Clostridium bovifaecis]|uniref:Flagellin n=1 Tax=Clostridium bovifaecis TaxID=2184719 RepID=A0A6I6F347_9CLOT|nr:flagellin [Clostridium bovifaecis]